jgi:hypothetical protein
MAELDDADPFFAQFSNKKLPKKVSIRAAKADNRVPLSAITLLYVEGKEYFGN